MSNLSNIPTPALMNELQTRGDVGFATVRLPSGQRIDSFWGDRYECLSALARVSHTIHRELDELEDAEDEETEDDSPEDEPTEPLQVDYPQIGMYL